MAICQAVVIIVEFVCAISFRTIIAQSGLPAAELIGLRVVSDEIVAVRIIAVIAVGP